MDFEVIAWRRTLLFASLLCRSASPHVGSWEGLRYDLCNAFSSVCLRNPLPPCMETRSSAEFRKELWIDKNKASFARRGIFGITSPAYLALPISLNHQRYRVELLHCVNRYCRISTGSFYNVWVFGRRGISEIYYEYSLKVILCA